jgi:hypothetical protein
MSHDPTAKPSTPLHTPTLAAQSPAPTAEVAPSAAKRREQEQISFWSSFFLGMTKPGELPVYHHSNLFYWWPVWAFGFLCAAISFFDDKRMAIVPPGTVAAENRQVEVEPGKPFETRDVLILVDKEKLVTRKNAQGDNEIFQPTVYVARNKGVGTVFIIILLVVTVITNITLRGLWSVFVLVVLVMLSIIFAVAGWWDIILARIGQLGIYINLGGYLTLSIILFILWCFNLFIFDRQTYMIFTPGQVRVRLEIGGGEIVYDTAGMVFHKERSDLFRHWVLGFGSGDLVVRPAGLGHALELPNVLRVGKKVKQIEQLVKEKMVVAGPTTSAPRP